MAAKKKKQAVRQQTAVPLPHDGPIHYWQQLQNQHPVSSRQDAAQAIDESDVAAMNLLLSSSSSLLSTEKEEQEEASTSRLAQDQAETEQTTTSAHPLVHLIQTLTTIPTTTTNGQIQHQLAALQACKTKILQQQQQQQLQKSRVPSSQDDDATTTTTAVYRLLLEWSASCYTPLPLRKSLFGLLDALWKVAAVSSRDNNATIATTIVQVVEPITKNASARQGFLKKPVHSLEVLWSLALVHDATTLSSSSDKDELGEEQEDLATQQPQLASIVLQRAWPFLQGLTTTRLLEACHWTSHPLKLKTLCYPMRSSSSTTSVSKIASSRHLQAMGHNQKSPLWSGSCSRLHPKGA